METDPGYLELPSTRTDFHGLSLFESLKVYCIVKVKNLEYLNINHYCSKLSSLYNVVIRQKDADRLTKRVDRLHCLFRSTSPNILLFFHPFKLVLV